MVNRPLGNKLFSSKIFKTLPYRIAIPKRQKIIDNIFPINTSKIWKLFDIA